MKIRHPKKKKIAQFLRALNASGGRYDVGTAPGWNNETGEFRECQVILQAGDKAIMMKAAFARIFAERIQSAGLTEVSDGLLAMVEIAEKMEVDKPTPEQAAAEYLGPSRATH